MRNASPAGVRNGARCSRVRSRLLSNAALSPTPAPAQITYMHPNHGPHDHAPHLPGRRTTYLKYQHVEVVPQLELAPPLAAANVAPVAPPHHPTQRTRAESLAHLALSSRREARIPHPIARRRPPVRAHARAATLSCERERQPTSGDVEQLAHRPEKLVVGGRWTDGDDACVAARFRPPWRPGWAAGERHRKDGRAVGARTARDEASLAQLLVFGASVLKIGGERQKNGAYCV